MLNMTEAEAEAEDEDSNRFKLEMEVGVGEAVSSNNNDTDDSLNLHLEEQQVPIAIATSLRPSMQPPNNNNSGCNKKSKKWIAGTVLVVIVIVLGVSIGTRNTTRSLIIKNDPTSAPPTDAPTAKCNGENLVEVMVMEEGNDDNATPEAEGIRRLIAGTDTEYLSIGCFRKQDSPDKRPLMAVTQQEKVDKCNSSCRTIYFGIVDSTCYCHSDPPQDRLSIGSCQLTENPCVEDDQKMEMYFKVNADETCSQDTTSKVRNFLVEEDDVPFGFDIVTNQFRPSPFELYKSECGTNVYEVQTEISQGSQELSTSVSGIKEFAKQERTHLSQSISADASAGYDGLFFKAMAKVSASADQEQTNMFRSSGAEFAGGRVFNSVGVKRLAEVKIVDFDNKKSFVTLNSEFVEAIKSYQRSGYDRAVAREQIFNKYGMFILTRGIFGGFLQLRSTMTESSISKQFESSEESRQCFEASVSVKASGFGFSGSVSTSGGECNEEAKDTMLNSQNAYAEQSSEQVVVGGKVNQGGNFVVEPEFSTLLTSRDKYPAGDKGIELRPLSDFLSPKALSPLNVMQYQIDEAGFLEIQTNLQKHMRDELLELEGLVGGCGECEVPYLVQSEPGQTKKYSCTCYDPVAKQNEAFEADDVVELRIDNGVHWLSYNTEWTQKLVGGQVLEWKETGRHANVIYLEDKNGREGATTRFDFNDKTVIYCAAVNGECTVTGTISVWWKMNRFGIDARDIMGLNEGNDGEYWESDERISGPSLMETVIFIGRKRNAMVTLFT